MLISWITLVLISYLIIDNSKIRWKILIDSEALLMMAGGTLIPWLHFLVTTVQTLAFNDITRWYTHISWLHFCTMGVSGDTLSIFLGLWPKRSLKPCCMDVTTRLTFSVSCKSQPQICLILPYWSSLLCNVSHISFSLFFPFRINPFAHIRLRKTVTNDRSAPIIEWATEGHSSDSVLCGLPENQMSGWILETPHWFFLIISNCTSLLIILFFCLFI